MLLVNLAVTVWNLQTIGKNWDGLHLTHEVIVALDELLSNLRDAETGQRGYLLTGEEPYLEPYEKSRLVIGGSLARVKRFAASNGIREEHARSVEEAALAKLGELEKTIQLRREKGLEAALIVVKAGRGRVLMDRLREQIAEMKANENQTRDQLKSRLEASIGYTTLTFLLVSALSVSLLGVIRYLDHKTREELSLNARWLTTTLRSIGDAVITTDGEGSVSFMNPVAERLTGWCEGEARGKPLGAVFQIKNEQTGQTVENPVARVLREGVVVGLANHTVLTAKDGVERPIEDSAAPINEGGVIQGVVLVFHDASEARETAGRIRLSEERYRSLVAATTQTVWMTGPDFEARRILTGEDPIGLPDEANVAGGWLDVVHPEDRDGRARRSSRP